MSWIDNRLGALETRCDYIYRWVLALVQQVNAANQGVRQAQANYPASSGSSGGGVYVCYPSSGISGATWSSDAPSSPGSASLTVYQVQGTTVTSMGTNTVYNWLPAAVVASKACYCLPDGDGNYITVSQSCS